MIAMDLFAFGTVLGSDIANHLWQSSLFAAAAWLLTLILRKNRARIRYWIWTAASVKFLVPFSLLISLGSAISPGWIPIAGSDSPVPAAKWTLVQNINQPFSPSKTIEESVVTDDAGAPDSGNIAIFCFLIWGCGSAGFLLRWLHMSRRVSTAIRESDRIIEVQAAAALLRLSPNVELPRPLRIAFSSTSMEPGVYGIFRPVLVLPSGIPDLLEGSELESILRHELSHVRNRDNLVAAMHMLVKTLFWFHPLVWWIGSRLIHERECACDEAVLQSGNEPQSYAEGILKVCEFYLESPLPCVSGVIGSNLKRRIERIMARHIGFKLSFTKKMFLTAMLFIALTVPLLIGILTAPPIRAQSQESPKPSFDVASIKPSDCRMPGTQGVVRSMGLQPGRIKGCSSLKHFISAAYKVEDKDPEISGGPEWIDSDSYMIEAKAEGVTDRDTLRLMLQSLLEERFGLRLHYETREQPVYSLVIAKGGHKLKEARDENGDIIVSMPQPGEIPKQNFPNGGPLKFPGGIIMRVNADTGQEEVTAHAITMQKFADKILNELTERNVVDNTGLKGYYDIEFHTAVDRHSGFGIMMPAPSARTDPIPDAELSGPSVFTAIQEQLGLKLEADKAPVEFLIIDDAEKPSEN